MEEIIINLENLTENEKETLIKLVEKGNKIEEKIEYPKYNSVYCYIDNGYIRDTYFSKKNYCDVYRYEHNNYFLTREEAEFEIERQKVLFELKYWGDGYYFRKKNNYGYSFTYDNDVKINYMCSCDILYNFNIWFDIYENAKKALEKVGEDRVKKYLFGVED